MITAKEALELTMAAAEKELPREMEEVTKEIKAVAKDGRSYLRIRIKFTDTAEKLMKNGFDVKYEGTADNHYIYTVTWY